MPRYVLGPFLEELPELETAIVTVAAEMNDESRETRVVCLLRNGDVLTYDDQTCYGDGFHTMSHVSADPDYMISLGLVEEITPEEFERLWTTRTWRNRAR